MVGLPAAAGEAAAGLRPLLAVLCLLCFCIMVRMRLSRLPTMPKCHCGLDGGAASSTRWNSSRPTA
jgi:hypothetical protein